MDAALAFELEDREKPLKYVLGSQMWYLPNTSNKCSNMGGGGEGKCTRSRLMLMSLVR
jgi:hypothetical protein